MLARKLFTLLLPLLAAHGIIASANPESNAWMQDASVALVGLVSYWWSLRHQTKIKEQTVEKTIEKIESIQSNDHTENCR